MVPVKMMQEILDLKDKGVSKNEIVEYLKIHNQNPPSERTVRKYYSMESVPDNPGANLEKEKVFAAEPFHSAIVEIVDNLPKGPLDCSHSNLEKLLDCPERESTLSEFKYYDYCVVVFHWLSSAPHGTGSV